MKRTNRFLSVLLSLIMIISIIPMSTITSSAEGFYYDYDDKELVSGDYEYAIISEEDRTCIVEEYRGTDINVAIPNNIDGYKVIEIYIEAFAYYQEITSIVIPDSVETIHRGAFIYCTGLSSVILGNSLKTIDESAFAYCFSLRNLTVPDNVVSIGARAFYGCTSLTSVSIGKGVQCMSYISYMTNDIGLYGFAFLDCVNLTNITVDNDNEYYSNDENGVLYNKDKTLLMQYPVGNTRTNYTIPNTVTEIGKGAFYCCENITSIKIPNSVISIGELSFHNCTYLTDIVIPDSVLSIGVKAFQGCASLTSVIIPDNVTEICDYTFYCCINLETVKIGEKVTSIGSFAFAECDSLKSIIIPNTVKHINSHAFSFSDNFSDVYYCGTEEQWNEITICNDYNANETLLNATIHFNCHTHSYASVVTAPTCTEQGYTTYTCECDDSYKDNYVPALGHEYTSKITKPATHTENGVRTYTCIRCPYSYTEVITATDSHNYTSVVTPPTCTERGYTTYTCSCGDIYIDNYVDPAHTPKLVTIPAKCTVAGMSYNVCEICGETIGEATVIPAIGHTAGEWETILEPTYEADGKKVKKCTVCGDIVAEEIIPMLVKNVVTDENTGVSMEFDNTGYDGVVDIVVEESFDGTAFDVIDTSLNTSQKFIYDITMTVDGVETQPNGKVTVKIPLPDGYDPNRSFVYHVNTEANTIEKMPATYENGYLVFETTHFSYYAVVEEASYSFSIQTPSRTEIRNKDGIILHAKVEGTAPKDSYVKWESSNGNFDKSADDSNLKIIAKNKGWTTFTAILCDADGNELARDSVDMYSKSGFFDKIGGFFRSLFGTTKVYEN